MTTASIFSSPTLRGAPGRGSSYSPSSRNLRKRPSASLACDDYFESWGRLRGVVAHARARIVRPGPELDRAVRLLKKKYKQYRDYEFDEAIALHIERVSSWGL